jgi:hypothetical protein
MYRARQRSGVPPHDHEYRPLDETRPLFEDWAAIFQQECDFAEIVGAVHSERHDEVFHGTGAECDETRKVRMDASYLWYPGGRGVPVTDRKDACEEVADLVDEIESAAGNGDAAITSLDPDPEDGEVRVQHRNYTLVYSAQ